MRWTTVLTMILWLIAIGNPAPAGTIYTWTDADGVKHYSNSQPPAEADNVLTIEEVEYDQVGADRNREEFNRMVEGASEEANRHFDQQTRKKAQQAAKRQRQETEARERQSAEEKARLMKEIEAIQNRALGPNFTQGMRDNLVRQLQEKIDQLDEGAAN